MMTWKPGEKEVFCCPLALCEKNFFHTEILILLQVYIIYQSVTLMSHNEKFYCTDVLILLQVYITVYHSVGTCIL